MLISKLFPLETMENLDRDDYEDSPEHVELKERLRKTLYYGRNGKLEHSSLPMTELAVEFIQEAAPRQLGKVDMYWASSVSRRAAISPCSMMLGMLYIERLKNKNPEYLQDVSSSDLFLISMMVASKYLYDEGITEEVFNDEWAVSADLDIIDINDLERQFLQAIDWNLFMDEGDFEHAMDRIEQRIALSKSKEHDHFTYTDLSVLLGRRKLALLLREMLREVCKVALVCSVAYVAGVVTMISSVHALATVKTCIPTQTIQVLGRPEPILPASVFSSQTVVERLRLPENETESELDLELPAALKDAKPLPDVTAHVDRSPRGSGEQIDHRPIFDPGPRRMGTIGLQLPGLLTLALLKDTVVQFVESVVDRFYDPHAKPEVRCHCPCSDGIRRPNSTKATIQNCDPELKQDSWCQCPQGADAGGGCHTSSPPIVCTSRPVLSSRLAPKPNQPDNWWTKPDWTIIEKFNDVQLQFRTSAASVAVG